MRRTYRNETLHPPRALYDGHVRRSAGTRSMRSVLPATSGTASIPRPAHRLAEVGDEQDAVAAQARAVLGGQGEVSCHLREVIGRAHQALDALGQGTPRL